MSTVFCISSSSWFSFSVGGCWSLWQFLLLTSPSGTVPPMTLQTSLSSCAARICGVDQHFACLGSFLGLWAVVVHIFRFLRCGLSIVAFASLWWRVSQFLYSFCVVPLCSLLCPPTVFAAYGGRPTFRRHLPFLLFPGSRSNLPSRIAESGHS